MTVIEWAMRKFGWRTFAERVLEEYRKLPITEEAAYLDGLTLSEIHNGEVLKYTIFNNMVSVTLRPAHVERYQIYEFLVFRCHDADVVQSFRAAHEKYGSSKLFFTFLKNCISMDLKALPELEVTYNNQHGTPATEIAWYAQSELWSAHFDRKVYSFKYGH